MSRYKPLQTMRYYTAALNAISDNTTGTDVPFKPGYVKGQFYTEIKNQNTVLDIPGQNIEMFTVGLAFQRMKWSFNTYRR